MPRLATLHAEAMQAGIALGATAATDLESLHRAALGEALRIVLVAEVDGEVVGMAHIVPSGAANAQYRAEVQRVAVAVEARRTGVGRRLMEAVEEAARERGLTLLWLTTHDGTDACAFYEAVGYTKLGVMPSYSLRPDGTVSSGAFYFRQLAATRKGVRRALAAALLVLVAGSCGWVASTDGDTLGLRTAARSPTWGKPRIGD